MAAKKPAPATSPEAFNASKPTPSPAAARDAKRGNALARRVEERDVAREVALLCQTLAAMAAIPDDRPGVDAEVMKAIDEGRPHRPLFRGYY
jgi:hypothetical protein